MVYRRLDPPAKMEEEQKKGRKEGGKKEGGRGKDREGGGKEKLV